MSNSQSKLNGRKVLIAEDCPDTREVLAHILSNFGADVTCSEDGQDALEAAITAEASAAPFNLVLLDIQMPRLDGLSAAKEMRKQGFKAPIVSVTARSVADDATLSNLSGCNGHISKLAGPQKIVDELSKHLTETAQPSTQLPALPLVPEFLIANPDKAEKAVRYIAQIATCLNSIEQYIRDSQYDDVILASNALAPLSFYGYRLFSQELSNLQSAALSRDHTRLLRSIAKLKKCGDDILAGREAVEKLYVVEH